MTHETMFQLRACPACQCRIGIDQEAKIAGKCGGGTGSPTRYLQAPGLSLCARSGDHRGNGPDPRAKGDLYGQVVQDADPDAPATGKIYGAELKLRRHAGPGSLSPQGAGTWPKGETLIEKSSWNTALTDCQPTNLSRPMDSWYPGGYWQRAMQTNA